MILSIETFMFLSIELTAILIVKKSVSENKLQFKAILDL